MNLSYNGAENPSRIPFRIKKASSSNCRILLDNRILTEGGRSRYGFFADGECSAKALVLTMFENSLANKVCDAVDLLKHSVHCGGALKP